MTRSSRRQQRARAARLPAAGVVDTLHVDHQMEQRDPFQQSELYDMIQHDLNTTNNNDIRDDMLISLDAQEQEFMQTLQVLETLLADPYIPDIELNDMLSKQAECFHQLELIRQQKEDLQPLERTQRGFNNHSALLEHDTHQYLNDQQLEEQIREIVAMEALQQGEILSLEMTQRLTETSLRRPLVRPTNQNRSFKGHILNPNQDEADDSTNTHTSSSTVTLSLSSSTSTTGSFSSNTTTTTILSADFGDDDVLPIEETSCVICCVDYRHGDEILRNAHANTTPCNHVFHTKCITSWIVASGKSDCPCCRSPFALVTAGPT